MKEKNVKKPIITAIIVAIVLMGGFYYLGYQNGKNSVTSAYTSGMGGGNRGAGMRGGGGMVNGSVISKDDTTITVQSRDGSSKIVLYSGSTQVMKSTSGTSTDIAVGSQVLVQGKTNSDGSVTAQTISIRPNMPKAGN